MKYKVLVLLVSVALSSLLLSHNRAAAQKGPIATTEKKSFEIDDKYLHLFSEEIPLDSTKGYFTGFPTAVVHKGIIYVIYDYHSQHQAVPGLEQDFRYYKYSKDGGKTWSDRKTIKLPASSVKGISIDYRGMQLVDDGNKIHCIGIVVPSDAARIKPYRSYYCQIRAKRNGDLTYRRFRMMPYVNEEGTNVAPPALLGDSKQGSNIVAGNMLRVNGWLYWCYYNSVRNVQLLRWNTKKNRTPKRENIEVLANIGDNNKVFCYSEVGMFYENGNIILSIRDENANNSNWKYELVTGELMHLGKTETRAFGPNIYKPTEGPALLTGRQYTYLRSREQLTRMDNLILLSPEGKIIKENIGFVGHPMGGDSMYCSTVEYNGLIYIFYYYGMNSSQVSANSRYTVAYKTIKVEDLNKLMD